MAQDKHKYYIKAWEKSSDNMEGKDPDYENTDSLSWEEAEKEQEKLRDKYQSVGIYAKKDDREVSITLAKGGKVRKVMKEFKEGKLKSGSGKKVKERKQAIAIALSEARKAGADIPKKKLEGGEINSLKMKKEEFDPKGDTVVEYDEKKQEWFWEDYKGDIYEEGFASEEQAYGSLLHYLEHDKPAMAERLVKGGMLAPNQMVITQDDGTKYFQSYDSMIAKIEPNGKVYLDEKYWDYSKTTGKYRNKFLGEDKKETEKKIASGEYTLTDLNKDKEKGGMYAKGGYTGKTPQQVWEGWSDEQQRHFLFDHKESISRYKKEYERLEGYDYVNLPEGVKRELKTHIDMNQYDKGGEVGYKHGGILGWLNQTVSFEDLFKL